ncbi:MAG: 1-acyl-sn-glycerol-3-phosphate acyltransferase [Clostridia bacterium]|nr:1-acyl-sn-glycerol-3-phosphate acyltransferase [Clostridia bacterium]
MAKKTTWMRYRHRVVRNIAYCLLYPYAKIKYGLTVEPFPTHNGRQYLVLYNHQTAFDQFFVGMAVKGAVYYVASEDLFSNGFTSSLIRWLVAPIPIKKQATDVNAVKNCLRVAREGGTIAIAPEGNRTYSGKTEYINPAIAPLARKLGLPIAFVRLEGGYGVQPRWSDVIRKGKMRTYVSRVLEPEEYGQMTNEELHQTICDELYVDESTLPGLFPHKKSAEYLERAMYVCPFCGPAVLESHGDEIACTACGRRVRYLPDKTLEGIGFDFPFRTVSQWYDHQCDVVNAMDPGEYIATPLFRDTADLYRVIVYKKKEQLRTGATVALYGDRIVFDEGTKQEWTLPFDSINAVAVLGRNKLNLYHDGNLYQLKSDKRFNALKYVNLYYRNKNIIRGDQFAKFLGV